MRRPYFTAVVLAILPFAGEAAAQRLIVVTNTMSVQREAAGVYLHSVDMDWGQPLPGADRLPGCAPAAPILLTPQAGRALLTTRYHDSLGGTHVATCRTAPFARTRQHDVVPEPGWNAWAACLIPEAGGQAGLVLIGERADGSHGARILPQFGNNDTPPPAEEHTLPGRAVAAAALPGSQRGGRQVAILCEGSEAPLLVLLGRNPEDGETVLLAGPDAAPGVSPVEMALAWDGTRLAVLSSGFRVGDTNAEAVTWFHLIDSQTLQPLAPPTAIPGTAHRDDHPLKAGHDGTFWVSTHSRGTDFGRVVRMRLAEGSLVKDRQHLLTGISGALQVAPSPTDETLAITADGRLGIWPRGERGEFAAEFADPIALIRWTAEGLLAAEGSRVHLIDPISAKAAKSVQLQSGHVVDLALLPAADLLAGDADADGWPDEREGREGTSPWDPDTDSDGIPDATDPEPLRVSPRLDVEPRLVFRGDAAGREVRVARIRPHDGAFASWQVEHDASSAPWLLAAARVDEERQVLEMAVDPARYHPTQPASSTIHVALAGTHPGVPAAGSPASIQIHVAPPRGAPHRILWVQAGAPGQPKEAAPGNLDRLSRFLAGPPHFFAHHSVSGVYTGELAPYTIVVLEAAAAARGALTRQAVLDYVSQGGALLFLGACLGEETNRALTRWLSPIGIQINTAILVEGRFSVAGEARVLQYWRDFQIEKGCAIGAEAGYTLEPGGPEGAGAVFVARPYGLGRIALLAAATPIEDAVVEEDDHRAFAGALFRWLARAAAEFEDMDGDGLPDAIEDRRRDGDFTPGETDYRDPDTDDDGVADGLEDANRNGRLDDGETDPRNVDSDGDGVFDGADSTPCPVFGSPYIARVEPASGPAEGGYFAVVSGSNLTPGSSFWFGDRKATWVAGNGVDTAAVRVPETSGDVGGAVAVRVAPAGGETEGVLPGAFTYTGRNAIGAILSRAGGQEDALQLETNVPRGVSLKRLTLVLRLLPEAQAEWLPPRASEAAAPLLTLKRSAINRGILSIIVEAKEAFPRGRNAIAILPYRGHSGAGPPPTRSVESVWSQARTPFEGTLRVEVATHLD